MTLLISVVVVVVIVLATWANLTSASVAPSEQFGADRESEIAISEIADQFELSPGQRQTFSLSSSRERAQSIEANQFTVAPIDHLLRVGHFRFRRQQLPKLALLLIISFK